MQRNKQRKKINIKMNLNWIENLDKNYIENNIKMLRNRRHCSSYSSSFCTRSDFCLSSNNRLISSQVDDHHVFHQKQNYYFQSYDHHHQHHHYHHHQSLPLSIMTILLLFFGKYISKFQFIASILGIIFYMFNQIKTNHHLH